MDEAERQARHINATRKPDREAIIRAVASSTAIETGKSVRQLEAILRDAHAGKLSA